MARRGWNGLVRAKRYDLCDGTTRTASAIAVEWWCPDRRSPERVRVFSVLPPPPVDVTKPVRWRNWCMTYDGTPQTR